MYNEELEMLIDAALADGVLTDKERQVLFRKAQQYGVNLDEFNMVLEGRLAQVKNQQMAAQKSTSQSKVKKCPACGALIQSMQVKCPECGYEFRNVEANTTVKQLQQKLDEIEASAKPSNDKLSLFTQGLIDPVAKRKASVIKNCPVPNSKDDLIELLTLCSTNYTPSSTEANNYEADAWKSKYKQVRAKAKILLKDDPDLAQVLEETDKTMKKNFLKKYLLWIILIPLALLVFALPTYFNEKNEAAMTEAKAELSVISDKVQQLISKGDYEQAANVLSFCQVDVTDSETGVLYSSLVIKVANELIEQGKYSIAESLYDTAVTKLGSYNENLLDPLAKKLGIETESMRKEQEKAMEESAKADEEQASTDNSSTGDEEASSTSSDGDSKMGSKLKDKANKWLDKQVDKMNDKIDKELDKLGQ